MILNILNNLLSVLFGIAGGIFYFINYSSCTPLGILASVGVALLCLIVSWIVLFVIIWLFFISVSLFINPKKQYEKPSKIFNAIFILWYSYICSVARIRIHTKGLELVPQDRKFLIVGNHRSNFDNMIQAYKLSSTQLSYISKPENFKIVLARRYMIRAMYLSIDRDDVRNALKTIMRAIDLIRKNVLSIGIFPEGTRSKTGELGDFKPGSLKIAEKAQCPIVVCCLEGTENIHKNFPFKPTHVQMEILKVIEPEEIKNSNTVDISEQIKQMLFERLGK